MELGLFKEQEIIMLEVLSKQEIWREKLQRKEGASSYLASVTYGKDFEFYPDYNWKMLEGGKIEWRRTRVRKENAKEGRNGYRNSGSTIDCSIC